MQFSYHVLNMILECQSIGIQISPLSKDAATQVNGDDFLSHQAFNVNLGTEELEEMTWSDTDADMEDSGSDWSLSLEESDEEDDNSRNMSSSATQNL